MANSGEHRLRRMADGLLVVLFLLGLTLPLADSLSEGALDPSTPVVEKRVLAELPEWSVERTFNHDFARAFETWFDDHFGFRTLLLRLNGAVHTLGLGVSLSPSVAVGMDGWLFLTDLAEEYQRDESLYDELELHRYLQMFETRRDWLAERGHEFLFVIAPNKHSVYPEKLPANLKRRNARSRADQLLEYLETHSDIAYLDLRATFAEARVDEQIYYATDSHWNLRGTRIAHDAIVTRLAGMSARLGMLSPLPDEAYAPGPVIGPGGDLAKMLAVEGLVTEHDSGSKLRSQRWRSAGLLDVPGVPEGVLIQASSFATVIDDPSLPSAVIIRDSFMGSLAPLLSEHFRRASYVGMSGRLPFPWEFIEREKPDVVLTVMVERQLMGPPPASPIIVPAKRFHDARLLVRANLTDTGLMAHAASFIVAPGRLELIGPGTGPTLFLPRLPAIATGRVVATLDLRSPADTTLTVRATAVEGGARLVHSVPVSRGRATLEVELPEGAGLDELSFELGEAAGRYGIYGLQLHGPQLIWSLDLSNPELTSLSGKLVSRDAEGLVMDAENGDPQIRLPPFELGPNERALVRVDMTVPAESTLVIFPALRGKASFKPMDQRFVRVPAGRTAVVLELGRLDLAGSLRVDPGTVLGRYVIHDIEVRAAK